MSKVKEKIPRGVRNCNPLNIRLTKNAKWAGLAKEQTDSAFCQFASMTYGWRAAFLLLRKYYFTYKLRTIRDIISRWAPSEDNNPTNVYIDSVVQTMQNVNNDFTADSQLPDPDLAPFVWSALVGGMAFVENGKPLNSYSSMDEILIGWHFSQLARR